MTPTGAAIAATVVEEWGGLPPLTLEAVGYGAGTKDFPDRPNVVRVVLGAERRSTDGPRRPPRDEPRRLPARARPGRGRALLRGRRARRVDRPGADEEGPAGLRALGARSTRGAGRASHASCFEETSALGVRVSRLDRYELDREERRRRARRRDRAREGRPPRRSRRQPRPRARRLRGACQVGGTLRKVGLGRGARSRPGAMTTIDQLEARIRSLESCIVAFSGGVDSSLVAALAARALGERALAVTAVSPALATGELDGAREVAVPSASGTRRSRPPSSSARGTERTIATAATTARPSSTTSSGPSPRAVDTQSSCPGRTRTTSATGGPGCGRRPSTA